MLEQVQIEHFHRNSLTEGAKIARKNRLYVPGWCIIDELRGIERAGEEGALSSSTMISIAYVGGKPVAACLLFVECDNVTCYMFVRNRLRRQGIGSKLFNEHWEWWTRNVRTDYKYFQPTVYTGVDGSEKFWQYMGIEVC